MTLEVILWPPRADIYTPAHLQTFSYTERENQRRGEEGMEVEKKKERRGRVLKSSALLIAQDLHFLISVSSDVG